MSEQIDFGKVEAAKGGGEFLVPGYWKLHVTGGKIIKPEGKNPFLEVSLEGDKGIMRDKFYLTAGVLPKFKYFYESWTGKPFDKVFATMEQVGAFFEKMCNTADFQKIVRNTCVKGKEASTGVVYTELGFGGFVVPDEIEEGAFEPGSYSWNQNVKKQLNASTGTNSVMIPDSSTPATDDSSGLPW
jgi:hypothetical protein